MSPLLKGLFGVDRAGARLVNHILVNPPPPLQVLGVNSVNQTPMEQVEGQAPVANPNTGATVAQLVGGEELVPTLGSNDDAIDNQDTATLNVTQQV